MTHKQAQIELLYYCLYKLRYVYVSHELKIWNRFFSDVFCIDNQYRTIEIEVKVSLHDLMSELKAIRNILSGKIKGNKPLKHLWYLQLKNPAPNKFYFAVPKEFVQLSKDWLKKTPYGVIEIPTNNFERCRTRKYGKLIHTDKISSKLFNKAIRHLSFENLNLLGKV